jgi:hypothetical protein
MTTLVLEAPDGTRKAFTLDGPGGTERFAVGEPGHRSSVWRMWSPKKKNDVYVAARAIIGIQKFSLHESGDWRHQWIKGPATDEFIERAGTRILDQWQRPSELAKGWTRGLSIWIPHEDVIEFSGDEQPRKDVEWLPKPPPGHLMIFQIALVRPDQGQVEMHQPLPVAGFDLIGGESVVVTAQVLEVDHHGRQYIEELRELVRRSMADVDISGRALEAVRCGLVGHTADGHRMVWDLSVAASQ